MKKDLSILRLKEIIGKTGFFMVGVLFARPALTSYNFLIAFQFLGLCLVNGISVYLINAGFGYEQDIKNDRLHFLKKYKQSSILLAGFSLLVIALILLYLFIRDLFVPALVVYFIWIIYSLPNGLKGIPIMGMMCAFIAQMIHFHLGYLVFAPWSHESIVLSIYFAVLFCGGHALHEVIDFDADKRAGINTSAVAFGKRNLFLASNYIFVFGTLYLTFLYFYNVIQVYWLIPYVLAFFLQLLFLLKLPSNWNKEDLFDYRRKYMTAYLLATLAVTFIIYL
jgi:4-hydroxybenzoate polyprenyltransferase